MLRRLASFAVLFALAPLSAIAQATPHGVVNELTYTDTAALLVSALDRGDWALVVSAGLVLATFAARKWSWASKLATAAKENPAAVKSGTALLVLLALSSQAGCAAPHAAYYRAPPEECRRMDRDRNLWGASAAGAGVVGGGLGGVGGLVESQDARTALAVSALVLAGVTAFAGYVSKGLGDQHAMYCVGPLPEEQATAPAQ